MDLNDFIRRFCIKSDNIFHHKLPPVEFGLEHIFGKVIEPDPSWSQQRQFTVSGTGKLPTTVRVKLLVPLPSRAALRTLLFVAHSGNPGRVAYRLEGIDRGNPLRTTLVNGWQRVEAAMRLHGATSEVTVESLCEATMLAPHFKPDRDMYYWRNIQQSRFGDALVVEFMNSVGVSNRSIAVSAHLRGCLRDDFYLLTSESNPEASHDMKALLLMMPRPQYLFNRVRLQKLFFEELVPMQIVARSDWEPVVDAGELVTFGLP